MNRSLVIFLGPQVGSACCGDYALVIRRWRPSLADITAMQRYCLILQIAPT